LQVISKGVNLPHTSMSKGCAHLLFLGPSYVDYYSRVWELTEGWFTGDSLKALSTKDNLARGVELKDEALP